MRITTSIVLFYVWFIASAGLMDSVGLTDAMGVAGTVSAGEQFGEAITELNNISGGGISAQSLVGIYTVVSSSIEGFLLALTAGPRLLANIGIPMPFVIFVHAPVALLAGRLMLYVLSGRDL